MNSPKVVIIIVNYNGLEDTRECLNSLEKTDYDNFQVVVVDNGSDGNEGGILEKMSGTGLSVVRNQENLGFTGGNNSGLEAARKLGYDYLLLLNNDTVVRPEFLRKMVAVGERREDTGIIGAKILHHSNGTVYAWGGGRADFWLDRFSYFGRGQTNDRPAQKSPLGYVSGCCMLVKKKVVEEIGLFDDRFFLYNEEVDLCLRAKKAGFRLDWAPQAVVRHKSARTSGYLSPDYVYYMVRNKLLLAKKNARWHELACFVPVFTAKEIVGYPALLVLRGLAGSIASVFAGAGDFMRGRFGKRSVGPG